MSIYDPMENFRRARRSAPLSCDNCKRLEEESARLREALETIEGFLCGALGYTDDDALVRAARRALTPKPRAAKEEDGDG